MIPFEETDGTDGFAAPRTRGDDPVQHHHQTMIADCSPHARG